MKRIVAHSLLFALLILSGIDAIAQGLSAFVNSRDEFYAFDNGTFKMLHHLPPQQFKVGYHHIAFVDHKGQLHVYSEGEVHDLKMSAPDEYHPMHCFLLIESNQTLTIFQDGKKKPLVFNLRHDYSFSDTMIAFVDYGGDFHILENRQVHEISRFPPKHLKAGPNNVAFTDQSNAFKYYLGGATYDIFYELPNYLLTETDLWYENRAGELLVFDGQLYTTGVDRFAFGAALNNAFLYQGIADGLTYIYHRNRSEQLLHPGESIMKVGENMIAINGLNDQFKIWYRGEVHVLENFIPDNFKIARDMIVYTDYDGSLKAMINGTQVNVTDEVVSSYLIHGKVIQFVGGTGREVLFYDGATFKTN
jgi:hypothetical protein